MAEASRSHGKEALGFEAVYRAWFERVVRWIPAMGVVRGDVEDVAQETFVIVARKLPGFDGENLGGWLYAITLRTANNHRRLAWFRRVLLIEEEAPVGVSSSSTPERELATKQLGELADRILAGMSDKARRAFVLFEVEGYSGEEIAELEGIPLATVWTRVHNARKEFSARAQKLRKAEKGGG